jgi:glutathione peroxidase
VTILDIPVKTLAGQDSSLGAVASPSPDSPGSPDPGSPDPGSPDPGSPDPGSPDPGSPDPGSPDPGLPSRALLVVNVASKCGLTPQYTALEKLHEQFARRGFAVVGFPCNQFGGQEPGTAEEIAEFCSATYGVTFPMFEKIEVNGPGRHPIYASLTETPDADGEAGDIQWNFEKFLVRPDGTVAARFRPRTTPDSPEVLAAIEANLPAD